MCIYIYICIYEPAHLHWACSNPEDQKTSSFVWYIFGMSVSCQNDQIWHRLSLHGSTWPSWYVSPKSTCTYMYRVYVYIYIYIKKAKEFAPGFQGSWQRFSPFTSCFCGFDPWENPSILTPCATTQLPVQLGHMAISEGPNLESYSFTVYIYIYVGLFASQQRVLLREGGHIPQAGTHPSEDHI